MQGAPPGSPDNPLRVAVIGSGPSGFYAVEHLLGQADLTVQVDLYDRLPTPFGLVRGGVAPDHQKIKSVTRIYDKIAAHSEFRFFGNVEVGRDIVREELAAYYHGIIYAVGARADRRMWIPNEHLPGSHSATEFVGWYNAHPDYRRLRFNLEGAAAAVVGNGNVAMDVARILASPAEALGKTDIADDALEALSASTIRTIHILGRRGPAQAAFTNKEIREFGELPGVDVVVDPADLELDEASAAWVEREGDKTTERNLAILRDYAERPLTGAATQVVLHFAVSPVEVLGPDRVTGLVLAHNDLYADEDGSVRPRQTERRTTIPVDLVFRAIGYKGEPLTGLPFDERGGIIPNRAGRIVDPAHDEPVLGEYVCGWIKRGPQGVIGTNKPCAQEAVDSLIDDVREGRITREVSPREVLERVLSERQRDLVTYSDWQVLDALERERGEADGRPRVKFTRIEEMLEALAERRNTAV
ncbi:MAG: NADP oxidoreductase [Miltoncostaeaceae bacterium]